MSDDLKDHSTMHISIPEEATDEEVAEFTLLVSEFILDRTWGNWDALIYTHTNACEDSDHCYGPGSNAERAIKAEAWDEAAEAIADWMWNNPGPSGIPHDPPRNPYEKN